MLALDVPQRPHCTTHVLLAANRALAAANLPPCAIAQSAFSQQALADALPPELGEVGFSEVSDFNGLLAALSNDARPDLILLDLALPGVSGIAGLLYLRLHCSDTPLVVVSAAPDAAFMRRCLSIGAAGYLPANTTSATIGDAIRLVLDGEIWTPPSLDEQAVIEADASAILRRLTTLTPQQVRVLMMLTQGLLNKQIAYELKVSEATVKAHVSAILQKLNVESRTQAVSAVATVENHMFSKRASA